MTRQVLALVIVGLGIAAFVGGVYGVIGSELSFLLAGLGMLGSLVGVALLLAATRPWNLSAPHGAVVGIAVLGAALHGYEHLYKSSSDSSMGFLLWSMVPYLLCLLLSAFPAVRTSVIAGAVLALVFDVWGHYSVFVDPQSSTAALALLFIPLWSSIVVVPVGTLIAWLVARGRRNANAP
jgi:hypothetical protein